MRGFGIASKRTIWSLKGGPLCEPKKTFKSNLFIKGIHKAKIGSQFGKIWKSSWVSFAKLGCSCVSGIAEFLLVVMAFFVCLSLFSHGLKKGGFGEGGYNRGWVNNWDLDLPVARGVCTGIPYT